MVTPSPLRLNVSSFHAHHIYATSGHSLALHFRAYNQPRILLTGFDMRTIRFDDRRVRNRRCLQLSAAIEVHFIRERPTRQLESANSDDDLAVGANRGSLTASVNGIEESVKIHSDVGKCIVESRRN